MDYGIAYSRYIGKMRRRKEPAGKTHLHHVVPKCLGGGADVVLVTPSEHEYAHFLFNMSLFQKGRIDDLRRLDYGYRPDCFRVMKNRAFSMVRVTVEDAEGTRRMSLTEAAKRFMSNSRPESAVFPKRAAKNVSDARRLYKFAMRILFRAMKGDGRYGRFRFCVAGEKGPRVSA